MQSYCSLWTVIGSLLFSYLTSKAVQHVRSTDVNKCIHKVIKAKIKGLSHHFLILLLCLSPQQFSEYGEVGERSKRDLHAWYSEGNWSEKFLVCLYSSSRLTNFSTQLVIIQNTTLEIFILIQKRTFACWWTTLISVLS